MNIKRDFLAVLAMVLMLAGMAAAAPIDEKASRAKEQELIAVLKSDAAAKDKAVPCKLLAVYGTKDAVPALAALLPNPELSSWARIPLEVIPGPEADAALRDAMTKTQGRVLVGIINSIGNRHDGGAVDALIAKLKDADANVAGAAAAALARIGGANAVAAIESAFPAAAGPLKSELALALNVTAERLLGEGDAQQAIKFYDMVRKSELPKPRIIEATRGAIVARQAGGIALLIETLHSSDVRMFNIALRAARELKLSEVADVLLDELAKAPAQRQPMLLQALADRGDAKALPVAVQSLSQGAPALRMAAVNVLDRIGDVTCVGALLDAAIGDDATLATAAKGALARLHGQAVDADLLARLQKSSGKLRMVLILLAQERKIDGALPIFVSCAEDADAQIRDAALDAIGGTGDQKQVPGLLSLLQKTKDASARAAVEKSLWAICSRCGSACVPCLMPLMQSADSASRITGLHALANCGGAESLAAVKSALDDKDETVQDEAARAMSTWPNHWPDDASILEPLKALAKGGKKQSHQVLALRGYFQFVQGTQKIGVAERVGKVKDILPLISRPEDKRLAIAALGAIAAPASLELLVTFTSDTPVAEDACSAIVGMMGRRHAQAVNGPAKTKALQAVIEKTKRRGLKEKAQELLKGS